MCCTITGNHTASPLAPPSRKAFPASTQPRRTPWTSTGTCTTSCSRPASPPPPVQCTCRLPEPPSSPQCLMDRVRSRVTRGITRIAPRTSCRRRLPPRYWSGRIVWAMRALSMSISSRFTRRAAARACLRTISSHHHEGMVHCYGSVDCDKPGPGSDNTRAFSGRRRAARRRRRGHRTQTTRSRRLTAALPSKGTATSTQHE